MKSTLLSSLFLSFAAATAAPAAITSAGDIMFTGLNTEGNDDLAFVLLASYDANTKIFFSDNEWNTTTLPTPAWNDGNEYHFSWSNSANLPAGTIITIGNVAGTVGNSAFTSSPTGGTTTLEDGTNRGFSASGETVYAYLGAAWNTTSPVFLTVAATGGVGTIPTGYLPAGFALGTNAIDLANASFPAVDIGAYTGSRTSQSSLAAYRPLLANPANWDRQDTAGDNSIDGIGPDVPFNGTAFSVVPEPGTPLLLTLVSSFGLLGYRRRLR